MNIWIYIVTWCLQVGNPCPSNIVGCLVYHFHWECNQTMAFATKDSALIYMDEINDWSYSAPKSTLDSMTLEQYLKQK